MPEQVRCPSCNAALRVPDNLLGKNVKCPKCRTTFLAETEEPAEEERIVREPRPAAARRRPRPPEDFEEEEELPPEDELEEVPEEEYEERPRRRRRGGRRRAEAEAAVAGPAIALIVLGIFDLVLVALGLLLRLLGVGLLAAGAAGQKGGADANVIANMAGGVVGTIIGVAFAASILMGGLKMKKLESYGSVMTASILAMLPCWNCCIIGLPIGIWALVVLNKPEVKDAFR